MKTHNIQTIINPAFRRRKYYEEINVEGFMSYPKEIVEGFILRGSCKPSFSERKICIELFGKYGNRSYNRGYLTVHENIQYEPLKISSAQLSYGHPDQLSYGNGIVSFFKPGYLCPNKLKKEDVVKAFRNGLERVLGRIEDILEDPEDMIEYFCLDEFDRREQYLSVADYFQLIGAFDLYEKRTGDFLQVFNDANEQGKKAILKHILSCDFENPKVIAFLEHNAADLLREVSFS